MPKLSFEDYIICFKKQFLLQKGRGGKRISPYYTNYNQQQRLKNDQWGIMVFIYCGEKFGFTDEQMHQELKISKSLYEILKEETPSIISNQSNDNRLYVKVYTKIKLVNNCVFINHHIRPIKAMVKVI